jgi:hypothetical protein
MYTKWFPLRCPRNSGLVVEGGEEESDQLFLMGAASMRNGGFPGERMVISMLYMAEVIVASRIEPHSPGWVIEGGRSGGWWGYCTPCI